MDREPGVVLALDLKALKFRPSKQNVLLANSQQLMSDMCQIPANAILWKHRCGDLDSSSVAHIESSHFY